MQVVGVVAGGGGGVLSCPLVVPALVVAGSPSAWEPGRAWKGHFLPSLGSLESLKEPGPQEGPGRPRKAQEGPGRPREAQEGPNRAKEC